MFNYQISFQSPGYLLLLVLVPVLWSWSYRGLGALGHLRRILALLFRTVVLVMLILALAEIQLVRTSDKLTVIYLVDQSLSIPQERREAMIQYVNEAIAEHREGEDRAGVIAYGRDAAIEIPPFNDDVRIPGRFESPLDPEYTNLAGAMKLAQAAFPEDSAKRVVVISDGNENMGNAIEQAQAMAASGIGIDVVPIRYRTRAEVIVERVAMPSDVRRGQPFDLKVVVSNSAQPKAGDSGNVAGRLVVSRIVDGQAQVLSDEQVVVPPGKKVFSLREKIDRPNFYQYEARFLPERPEDDGMPQNNRATTFTRIRGRGQVLVIEDFEHPGHYKRLAEALGNQNLEVTVMPSSQLFTSRAELWPYDAVILANVPREHFTDAHVKMLADNTQQMGAGMVMIGGPNGMGAGGWANTEVEKAMPVDFQIKSAKVVPRGALAMLMHASEIADGNHWQKVIAQEAIKALGPRDYCGVVHWNGNEQWLWQPSMAVVGDNRDKMLAKMSQMMPGDMPDFDPAMVMAGTAFSKLPDAAIKHMIVISDGDPSRPTTKAIQALVNLNVTVSTVAVGAHGPAESRVLAQLASATGGKFYKVNNAKLLPKIFQREARRVARPLIKESPNMKPTIRDNHEMVEGINDLPSIDGYVMTNKKESQLAQIIATAPLPPGDVNNTLLAGWTYGLGKTAVFTSDASTRWDQRWTNWSGYDKFFGQIIRWSMRPVTDDQNFTLATEYEDGRVRVVVNALDKSDAFLNFLEMSARVSGPDLEHPPTLKMEQTAPGRYEGSFVAGESGAYFVTISPGADKQLISAGVNVPYSDEFRDRTTNEALLEQIAGMHPKGASPDAVGQVIEAPEGSADLEPLLKVNSFRHDLPKAFSSQDAWFYFVLIGSCLFFFDVFVRRVQVNFDWVPVLAGRARDFVLRREAPAPQSEYMERLRSRKAEVSGQMDEIRQTARYEVSPETPTDTAALDEAQGRSRPGAQQPGAAPSMTSPQQPEEESYTSRLLKAKRKVWEERDKNKGKDEGKG